MMLSIEEIKERATMFVWGQYLRGTPRHYKGDSGREGEPERGVNGK